MSQNPILNYLSEFKVFGTLSKDFWLTTSLQFIEGLAYFSMINILTLFLTQNCGFSDYDSGAWVSIFTLYVTAFLFAIGAIVDIIGIKKAFYIGLALLVAARFGVAIAPEIQGEIILFGTPFTWSNVVVKSSIILLSLGTAFSSPVIQAALRRFTSKKNRATGFSIYYMVMNIGAFLSTFFIIGYFRKHWGAIEGNSYIMHFGYLVTIIAAICVFFINDKNYAEKEDVIEEKSDKRPLAIFMEVWKEKPFQRLALFLFLSLGVRLVFSLQFLIFPKYYTRLLYEDFELGFANCINPLIIVVGLLLIIPLLNRYSIVKLMVTGMSVSAFSMLLLIFPIEWYLAVPGINTLSQAFVFVVFAQIVLFAIGELLFNPRFTEYVASVAPKDKVASYMSLSALPMYIAKPLNGFLSGLLVSIFCYEGIRAKIDMNTLTYSESPQSMWLIYLILAILSPVSVLLFRKHLSGNNPPASREKLEEAVEIENTYLDPQEKEAEAGLL